MLALVVVLGAALMGLASPAHAGASPSGDVASKRAQLDRAVRDYQKVQARLDRINAKINRSSAELDKLVVAQDKAQTRLGTRAESMYRTGETSFVSVVLGSNDFEEFSARWALLTRINHEDAVAISDLRRARKKVARSAKELLKLQTDASKETRALDSKVASAKKKLASSQAAYGEYRRRIAAAKARATRTSEPADSSGPDNSGLSGSGAWKSALASHYGINFTGRGASGQRIGPNSMMVAHKTLPFGTLIEIKYRGKRCVASVQDRGPYSGARVFDLGPGVIRVLGFRGVDTVQYRIISR